jgi:hypothetical protein
MDEIHDYAQPFRQRDPMKELAIALKGSVATGIEFEAIESFLEIW